MAVETMAIIAFTSLSDGSTLSKTVLVCEHLLLSIKAVLVTFGVVVCAVSSKDTDEAHNDCLQLDDDREFPAIGHSAFIY